MAHILIINHYAGSPVYGMEFRSFYFAREWVRAGHKVLVIAASFSHLRASNPACKGTAKRETLDGVDFLWLKTPHYQGNGVRRVINMFAFLLRLRTTARQEIVRFKPDVVIASSTYTWDNWVAAHYANVCRAEYIYEVHDLWPLTPRKLGRMSAWHPFIVSLQLAENFACRRADHVISLLPHAKTHFEEHGMDAEKFAHIPNGVVPEAWLDPAPVPDAHMEAITAYRARHDCIVGYTGGHGVSNALDHLVSVAAASPSRIGFVCVGDGPEKERLMQRARTMGADILFLPPVPKACVPLLLSLFDTVYLGWADSPLYHFGISSNKLFDYMMAGVPILHVVDAANDPVADARCGFSVLPGDVEGCITAIEEVARLSPAERVAMGSRGREYVLHNHSIPLLAERFLSVCGTG